MAASYPLAAHPVDMSDTAISVYRNAPMLGEHTDAILAELGYEAAEIADLRERKVI